MPKKVLFIEPPPIEKNTAERFAGCSWELYHFPDLANIYPFLVLEREGFEAEYLDAVADNLTERRFIEKIKEINPDIFILHSVILSKTTDIYYIKYLEKTFPQATILIHGPEPTRVPEQYLFDNKIIVFKGEIEQNLLSYLKTSRLSGVSVYKEGEVVDIADEQAEWDYDWLPHVKRSHAKLKKYFLKYYNPKLSKHPQTVMMASRGCSFNCRFCVPNSLSFSREMEFLKNHPNKPKVKIASAGYVTSEFRQIKEDGFNSVMIVDDQFLWDKERSIKICSGIKNLGLKWGCLSRADFLNDEDLIKALAQAGCETIDIGVESFSQEILDDINKGLSSSDIITAIELLKKYKISPKLNIMLGVSPLSSKEEVKHTVRQIKNMGLDNVMFSIATPFKGTKFYQQAKENSWLIDDTDKINPLGKAVISYPSLKARELERLQKFAYRSLYLRPGFIFRRIKKWLNPMNLFNDIKIALRIFK